MRSRERSSTAHARAVEIASDGYAKESMNSFCRQASLETSASCRMQEEYRGTMKSFLLDVPEDHGIDFRTVVLAADAVHKRTSGQVSSRAFLVTRHPALNGRAPIEVMADPDGPQRIRYLAEVVAGNFS